MDPLNAERVRRLASGPMNWPALLDRALRHGVMPLLYRQLKALCPDLVPLDFMARLEDHFLLNAARNEALTRELCRVYAMLDGKGISVIPYKGPVLACAVYGDLALRQFSDLDVMVGRDEIERAAELLLAEGYSRQWQLTPRQERAYLKTDCERLFSREGSIFLDVHWAVVRSYFPLSIPLELYRARLEEVTLGSCEVQTFAGEDQLVILCAHASKDLWSRLVWVCDIAEILRANPQLEWATLLAAARGAKTGRMLLLGLYLAHHLLSVDLPSEVLNIIKGDGVVLSLAGEVEKRFFNQEAWAHSSLAEFIFYLRLMAGPTEKLRLLARYWLATNPADWNYLPLPDALFFLYPALRPWRLLQKHRR